MLINATSPVSDGDFFLKHSSSNTFWSQDFHAHQIYEILYFIAGEIQYYLEDVSYSLVPGDILIIPPSTMHRPVLIAKDCVYTRMVMEMAPDYCRRLMQRVPDCFLWTNTRPCRVSVSTLGAEEFTRNIQRLMELPKDTRGILERDSICTLMLLQFDRALRENLAGEDSPPQQIHEILRYINAHFTQPLSLDDIAERFFLSKFYLLRQFKNYTNCTIHDYILTKRILLAKALLRDGMLPGEVGENCGFSSYASFYQAFHKRTGVSPSRYILEGEEHWSE